MFSPPRSSPDDSLPCLQLLCSNLASLPCLYPPILPVPQSLSSDAASLQGFVLPSCASLRTSKLCRCGERGEWPQSPGPPAQQVPRAPALCTHNCNTRVSTRPQRDRQTAHPPPVSTNLPNIGALLVPGSMAFTPELVRKLQEKQIGLDTKWGSDAKFCC